MLSVTNFREGALLNCNHGIETDEYLQITVEGLSSYGTPVKVNGVPAQQDGLRFSCDVKLSEKINTVEVSTKTCYGEFVQRMTLVWDKKSFRRCCFYIDDHAFLFTDLAKQRPAHAFDHFYLKELKRLYDIYGAKITLNSFYHNDHEEFLLKDMPDIWKAEFEKNSDWLKFALHAYSEFPDRPYADASRKDFLRDYELMKNEVTRFAGENAFIVPQVMHWNNVSPGIADELIKLGANCYSESMRTRVMSTPPYEEMSEKERQNAFSSEVYVPENPALARHYGFAEEVDYLDKHGAIYDPDLKIFFHHDWLVCNRLSVEEIKQLFALTKAKADKYGTDLFSACGHEQYSFPYYFNYQEDHFQKLETTLKLMVEDAGCRPVFYQHGLLGNPAWD